MASRPEVERVGTLAGLSLCAGVGGSDLALRLALGDAYRAVGHVERDAYAAAALVGRMEVAELDPAPVWDDLATFDGRPWRGRVDLVAAGFPCQPFSSAGKRLGGLDVRWLWDDVARDLDECGAELLLVENVPGIFTANGTRCAWCGGRLRDVHALGLTCSLCGGTAMGWRADPLRAFDEVLGTLAGLGFDAEWDVFSAAGVGAPHRRRRLYLLAWRVPDAVGNVLRIISERGERASRIGRRAGRRAS